MTSFTSDLPTTQIVDKLQDLAPTMRDIAPLREAADPVVERINEALGRSSTRSWRWIVVGALAIAGVVALVTVVKRRRTDSEAGADEQPVRLAS